MNARTISVGIVIRPASVSSAMSRLMTAAPDWAAMRSHRLLTRSLTAPPTTPNASIGTNWAKLMRPRSNGVPPSSSISHPIATVCIQTPRLEINAPMANRPWLRFIAISDPRRIALARSVRRLSLGTSAHYRCLFPIRIWLSKPALGS